MVDFDAEANQASNSIERWVAGHKGRVLTPQDLGELKLLVDQWGIKKAQAVANINGYELTVRRYLERAGISARAHRRHATSVCPRCRVNFLETGNSSGVCSQCVSRRATWAAPPRAPPAFYEGRK